MEVQNLHIENCTLIEKNHSIRYEFFELSQMSSENFRSNFQTEHVQLLNENYIISKQDVSNYPIF